MKKDNIEITAEMLESHGFMRIDSDWECKYMTEHMGIDDYSEWRFWTEDTDKSIQLKIDASRGLTNNSGTWHIHLDNCCCSTVGCADITYVWQFNGLMEIFGSSFRLKA